MTGSKGKRSTEPSGLPPAAAGLASSSNQPVYEYDYFAPGEDWFPSPMVPVAIQAPTDVIVATWALADTGADSTAFPIESARDFGIDIGRDCAEEKGMSASDPDSPQFVYRPGFMAQIEDVQFPMFVTFMDTPQILLGQEDFFRQFKVTFDHRRQKVSLMPYPKQIKGP